MDNFNFYSKFYSSKIQIWVSCCTKCITYDKECVITLDIFSNPFQKVINFYFAEISVGFDELYTQ